MRSARSQHATPARPSKRVESHQHISPGRKPYYGTGTSHNKRRHKQVARASLNALPASCPLHPTVHPFASVGSQARRKGALMTPLLLDRVRCPQLLAWLHHSKAPPAAAQAVPRRGARIVRTRSLAATVPKAAHSAVVGETRAPKGFAYMVQSAPSAHTIEADTYLYIWQRCRIVVTVVLHMNWTPISHANYVCATLPP